MFSLWYPEINIICHDDLWLITEKLAIILDKALSTYENMKTFT